MVILEVIHNNITEQAWVNLVDYAYDTAVTDNMQALAIIVSELQKFNGNAPQGKRYLEFTTDEDVTTFLLTWA